MDGGTKTTVDSIMSRALAVLHEDASITDAAKAMRDHDVGGVIVNDSEGKVCGFVTDRDLVVRGLATERPPHHTTLRGICTRAVVSVRPTSTIEEAIRTMKTKAIRRIPVVADGKAVGMLSLGDVAAMRDAGAVLDRISTAPPTR
jgi:CBS domain-containing protein